MSTMGNAKHVENTENTKNQHCRHVSIAFGSALFSISAHVCLTEEAWLWGPFQEKPSSRLLLVPF